MNVKSDQTSLVSHQLELGERSADDVIALETSDRLTGTFESPVDVFLRPHLGHTCFFVCLNGKVQKNPPRCQEENCGAAAVWYIPGKNFQMLEVAVLISPKNYIEI